MSRDITIGGRLFTVERFTGFKALRIAAIVGSLSDKVPAIVERWGAFRAEYRAKNTVTLDRASATFRYPDEVEGISNKAWEASDNVLTLPTEPNTAEQVIAVLPGVMEVLREDAFPLLAVVASTREELEAADERGEADEFLKQRERELLHEDLEEVLELATVAAELVREQFADKVAEVGKAIAAWSSGLILSPGPNGDETTSSASKPSSSTDSPPPTDGPVSASSTASPGANSGS